MTIRTLPGGFCPKPLSCLATRKQKWRENENLTNLSVSGAFVYFHSRCVLRATSKVPRPIFHPLSNGTLRFSKNCTTFALHWSQRENAVFLDFDFCGFYFFSRIQRKRLKQILLHLIEELLGYLPEFLNPIPSYIYYCRIFLPTTNCLVFCCFRSFVNFPQQRLRRLKQILLHLVEERLGYLSVFLNPCFTVLWLL